MKISAFVDLRRTLLPCTGVGRHANGVLAALAARADTEVTLLIGDDQCGPDGTLPTNAPLRALPQTRLGYSARRREQIAKATCLAMLDHAIPAGTDWIYCPHDTFIASRKAPVAITIHDARLFEPNLARRSPKARARDGFMRAWMRRAANAASIVFTVSEFSKARLVALMGIAADKVIAVGNGLDPAIQARAQASRSGRTGPILAIGGLRHLKGGDTLVAVAERLAAAGEPDPILSVGGPDDPDLAARADRLPNLTRAGFLSDEALVAAIADARALVFLSRYEGFGMPPIEAMALGTPVIAAGVASLPEIVGDGAILVKPDDVDTTLAALRRLRYDTAWSEGLLARGRIQAARHTWEGVADKVAAALEAATRTQSGGGTWDSFRA